MKTHGILVTIILTSKACWSIRPNVEYEQARTGSIVARETIEENDVSDVYDFVIAGGGLAGLALAARLAENSDRTVLVLEAGSTGDAVADRVNAPSGAYYSSIVGTEYDWGHVTVPQSNLNGRSIDWPRGKILGGSSAMNAMYLVRPAQEELNAWQRIISTDAASVEDANAANKWGWQEMYAAMRKSENFSAPRADVQTTGNIQWNASTHGSGGPMSVSYPGIMMQIVGNWTSVLNTVGIPTQPSPNGGVTLGAFVTPSSINPNNWTRSYSRSAYIDPLPPRSNLHILPEATVSRIIFRGQASVDGWIATGVEFARSASAPRRTVRVRREVILSGGTIGSPRILMSSGFGPRDILQNVGISVVEELPGVGQHLQDHLTAGLVWQSPLETAGDIQQSGSDFAQSPEFLSFVNDAVAFVNITTLFGVDNTGVFQRQIFDAFDTSTTSVLPDADSDVVEGYRNIYGILSNTFFPETAHIEFLMSVMAPGTISIQAALQHPYSQGRLYINSSNPFDPVVIDPRYLSHFADVTILRQGVKLARTIGAAFGELLGTETSPGSSVQTDEDWETWLRNQGASTQYHPSSSCSMLPRGQGGVVDAQLRVYGAANVRVVDSSVFPFDFAAHLASATFGLAEQAANIIQSSSYVVPNSGMRSTNLIYHTFVCLLTTIPVLVYLV